MKRFIGVDLHKNNFTVCYMGKDGEQELLSFKVDVRGIWDRERLENILTVDLEPA